MRPRTSRVLPLVMSLVLAACAGPAGSMGGTSPVGNATPPPVASAGDQRPATPAAPADANAKPRSAAAPQGAERPSAPRVVRTISDPNLGKQQTVKRYWDYGRDAPFQVAAYTAKSLPPSAKLGPAYADRHQSLTASVALAKPKARPTKPVAADKGPGGETAPATSSGGPLPDNAVLEGDASFGAGDTSASDFAIRNQVGAAASDALGEDPDFPAATEAASALEAPHQVSVEIDVPVVMANVDVLLTATDEATRKHLSLAYDNNWQHFAYSNDGGKGMFEINPDGTFMVGRRGAPTVKAAVAILAADPVVRNTSPHCIASLAARVARLSPQLARGGPSGDQGGAQGFRILSLQSDDQARCYVVLTSLLKHLLKRADAI